MPRRNSHIVWGGAAGSFPTNCVKIFMILLSAATYFLFFVGGECPAIISFFLHKNKNFVHLLIFILKTQVCTTEERFLSMRKG